ncbi:MAG: PLP-dependent aminotransferase family protein [Ginsengibacter sp.]
MAKVPDETHFAGLKFCKQSDIPLYMQVYNQFREMILSKRLRVGDRLPATRALAHLMNISRTSVTLGFEQLILEGYLTGKTGSGTYVADIIPDELLIAERAHRFDTTFLKKEDETGAEKTPTLAISADLLDKEDIIPFVSGTPALDQFPYKKWSEVGGQVLKKMKYYHTGYDSPLGYWTLRQQIASYLRITRAVNCEPEQVIIVSGSQQGLNLIIDTFLTEGDAACLEDPGYIVARSLFLRKKIKLIPVPVEKDGLNINYLIEHGNGAKLGFITPSHQYPLGVTLSLAKRLQLLEAISHLDMWILEDDYDSEFRYDGKPLASLQGLDKHGKVIYTGTFSKVMFPGLRLAYIVLPSVALVNQLCKVKAILDRQSPIMDQLILSQFIEEGHFIKHVRKMRLLYSERQKILVQLMSERLGGLIETPSDPAGMNLIGWLSPAINIFKLREEIQKANLNIAFIEDYTIQHKAAAGIKLGYTALSKYKLKLGVDMLVKCVEKSII